MNIQIGINEDQIHLWDINNAQLSEQQLPSELHVAVMNNGDFITTGKVLVDQKNNPIYQKLLTLYNKVIRNMDSIEAPHTQPILVTAELPKNVLGWWGLYLEKRLNLVILNELALKQLKENQIEDILAHELLHSGLQNDGHGNKWCAWASKLNDAFNYQIVPKAKYTL